MPKCITCGFQMYGAVPDENGECADCRRSEKCPDCRGKISVLNGVHYCPKCNPMLWAITSERKGFDLLHALGSDSEEMEDDFDSRVVEKQYGVTKITWTLWRQTYYGPVAGGRSWEKFKEVTIQKEFRGRSSQVETLDDYMRSPSMRGGKE